MKKLLTGILFFLLIPFVALATPVSWDFNNGTGILQPLTTGRGADIRGSFFTGTSTSATSTFPNLQATTRFLGAGLTDCDGATNALIWNVSTWQFGCNTIAGGGASFPFTPTTYAGVGVNSTSTPLWLTATNPYSLIATSTFITYASTTQLSVGSDFVTDLDGTGLTLTSGALNVDTSQNIATLSNLTSNGILYTSGGVGTLNVDAGALDVVRGGTGLTAFGGVNTVLFTTAADTLSFDASNFIFNSAVGALGLGTSTPVRTLTIASSTAPQLMLTSGTGAAPHGFRSTGGNFYLSTSSPTTFATTTQPILTADTNGKVGIGTSTPTKQFSVNGEAFISSTTTVMTGLNVLGGTGTSTGYIYSKNAGFGGRFILEDSDAAGCTEVYALNGVLTAAIVTCPTEI